MSIRVAINGFGRIGRSVFRVMAERKDIDIVAINDVFAAEQLAYLLQFDSVMGTFPHPVRGEGSRLFAGDRTIALSAIRDPAQLPWEALKVDVVIESTGRFASRADLSKHLQAGAKKVLLTVPPKDDIDNMIVMGVNDQTLRPDHRLISNASCTTNCLAPIAKVLDDTFGIEYGLMNTVHAYTNDQSLQDSPHNDLRRARAAACNIIPTSTGAARAVGKILPKLKGKLDGMATRVPVIDGSVVDLSVKLRGNPTVLQIQQAMADAASGPMQGILAYSTAPIVSSDIVGNSHSSIFDAPLTQSIADGFARVVAWYDNEWGYSNRCVELLLRMMKP